MQNTTDKSKWIGYSKKVAYPISRLGKYPNTGWTYVEGWTNLVCCTFEKIVKQGTKI